MPLHPPEIRTIFPLGGVQGSTVEVLVDGQNVAEPLAVSISGAGVQAHIVTAGSVAQTRVVGTSTSRIQFEIAPDAPVGVREFRLLTSAGLTNRALFQISKGMSCVREIEPNNTLATAQKVAVPATIEGKVDPSEDVDVYRFTVEAGEELLFSVTAKSLESPLDAVLTLRDASGRELASNDDYVTVDPVLAYHFPRPGEYFIEVREVDYGGSIESSYRLTISRQPFLRTVYPLGAARGSIADFSLFGLNLARLEGRSGDWYMPGWEAPQARNHMPANVPPGPQEFSVATPGGVSNAVLVEAVDVPEVREVEPNDDSQRAQRLSVPGVAHGQIYGGKANPGGDIDLFRFGGKRGQKLRLSILARARGSLLDAVLTVRDVHGKKLAKATAAGTASDPNLEFDPPADGDYLVEVKDLTGGGGLEFVYLLRIEPVTPPEPDFELAIYPANPSVPQGGSVPVEVRVQRKGGFTGPIQFELPPLPPGVTAFVPGYGSTANRFYIGLSATPDAPRVLGPFGLTGKTLIRGKPVARSATGSERVWKLRPLKPQETKLFGLGVCDPPDFTLRLDRTEVTLAPGQSVRLAVRVNKIANYPRGIPIRAATVDYKDGALPAGLSVSRVTLPPEAREVEVQVAAANHTAPGSYPIFICGLSNPSTNDYILVAQLAPPLRVNVVKKTALAK
jgi:hypothetical protein